MHAFWIIVYHNTSEMMKQKTLILSLFLALTLPVLAYEPPITEPGADNVDPLYTTTTPPPGPNRAGNHDITDDTGGINPGEAAEGSPVGAPWVLLGLAAVYGAVKLRRRE